MNRTDRLLAIVLELQRHGQRRAEDLAATFEVSKRTIYRDIQALEEAGVPLIAMAGFGYSLMENYFLPPVNFTTDEALMLILGSDSMQQSFDAQYQQAAQSAATKIETILPDKLREEINYLRNNFTLYTMKDMSEKNAAHLAQIRRAMIERHCIRISYTKRTPEIDGRYTSSERMIAPYSLASLEHDWYLMAYCYLREGIRVFRLNRIDKLEFLPNKFERPVNFDPQWKKPSRPRHVYVKVHITDNIIRWVRESRPYTLVEEEQVVDGWVLTFHVQYEQELLQWVLGWGRQAKVLEPQSLRQMVIDEIRHILHEVYE